MDSITKYKVYVVLGLHIHLSTGYEDNKLAIVQIAGK